jgi:hypothetical protein
MPIFVLTLNNVKREEKEDQQQTRSNDKKTEHTFKMSIRINRCYFTEEVSFFVKEIYLFIISIELSIFRCRLLFEFLEYYRAMFYNLFQIDVKFQKVKSVLVNA